jgi:cell division protein ZapA
VTSQNKVTVKIASKDYTLVGVESDEYIQRVGLYIDKKMNEIMARNNRLSTSLSAVLTAINVADDFFKTRENESSIRKELSAVKEELERLKAECKQLKDDNSSMQKNNAALQLELAKREAELGEVRKSSVGKEHTAVSQKVLSGYDM